MGAEIAPVPTVETSGVEHLPELRVITYPTSTETIAGWSEKFSGLTADTREGYEQVRIAIGALRSTRTAIEARRKELKAGALEYGRKVDVEAKRLTDLVAAIELPLEAKKKAVDDEKARQKAAEEQAKLDALREEIRQKEEAAAAERRAAQEAEDTRLADERARLDAERQQLEAERRERDRRDAEARAQREAEEAKLRAERDAIAAERRKLDADAASQRAREQAERDAKARAERERIEAEEARVRDAEQQARREALRPDIEKIATFVEALRAITAPVITDPVARAWVAVAIDKIADAADGLETIAGLSTDSQESFL